MQINNNITFKGVDKSILQKAVKSALNKSILENIDVCKQMPELQAKLIFEKFKQACPTFIQEQMDKLYNLLEPIRPEEINSIPFYHATTKEKAQNIVQMGYDIFKLNETILDKGAHRVGNYVRELGPAVYSSPQKDSHSLYGDTILTGKVNVKNPFVTLRSLWTNGVENFFNQLGQHTDKMGYTLQEKYVTANRFLHDFVTNKKIDAIFMPDDTGQTVDQLAIFDPKKIKFKIDIAI